MAMLVIGYNVEYLQDSELTQAFLRAAQKVHTRAGSPCTFYLLGDVVREHAKSLEALAGNPLFDFQITTRRPLKTVCQVTGGKTTLWRGATTEQIEEEISGTQDLLREEFGVEATGVSSPLGYHRGLMDRPDVLEALDRCGIRFCRTYGRNQDDWQPVDFRIEPYWYVSQGFSHILEFPGQGWQQSLIRPIYGWDETEGYVDYLKGDADEAARRPDLVWSHWAHDWSAVRDDKGLGIIKALLAYAEEIELDVQTQLGAYRLLREREPAVGRMSTDPETDESIDDTSEDDAVDPT